MKYIFLVNFFLSLVLSFRWIIICFLVGFLTGAFLISFYIRKRIFKIINRERHEYSRNLKNTGRNPIFFKYLTLIEFLKKKKDDYKSLSEKGQSGEKTFQNQQITELKNKYSELLNENIELGKKLDSLKLESTALYQTSTDPCVKFKKYFFSIPEIDGAFKFESAFESKEHDCIYELAQDNNTGGNIFYLSGDFDLRAIENIDYYLNPVCEIQNIGDRSVAKKVEMIQHGTFMIKGNIFQVIDRVKIKLA